MTRRRQKKGISPLVAVIMLIAFTMIVAGILAGWATRFATEQRHSLEKCVRANMVIKRAVFETATMDLTLMIYNSGTVPLDGFTIYVSYRNETEPPNVILSNITMNDNTFHTVKNTISYTDLDYVEIRSKECQGAYDLIRSYDIIVSA